ncbi:kelch domain-containing protein 2-like [Pocillopora damicornis]|uniref:kelch domain-containing protein 2-like n=1 Tax=Pocillopora damicornis TaxID=46731 RepID=UPI000F54F7CF|nr:kelch domain-containing protein 2-like [Pocillopora damicornis]
MTFVFPSINGTVKPRERSGHVAVHHDGYLVVWGGYCNGDPEQFPGLQFLVDRYHPSNEVWLYCIETSAWKHVETSGDIPPPMSGSTACVIGGKYMYIFAGHHDEGPSSTVFVLDLNKFVWQNLTEKIEGNPPSDRDKLCCWTHNDLIVYFGGYGIPPDPHKVDESCGFFTFNTSVEDQFTDIRGWNSHMFVLDTERLTWSQPQTKGRAPTPRAAQAAAKLGNIAYIFGGRYMEQRRNDLHAFDMDSMEWSGSIPTTGKVPDGRTWHSLSAVSDKHLFLYGGFNNQGEALGDAYTLDTSTMIWFQLSVPSIQSKPMTRMWHTACCTTSPGEVLIFGGCATSVLILEQEHCDSILIFRFTPQPLNLLCADTVVKCYSTLQKQLRSLPKNLLMSLFLHRRLQASGKI